MEVSINIVNGKVTQRVTGDTRRISDDSKFDKPLPLLFDPRTRYRGLYKIREEVRRQNSGVIYPRPLYPKLIEEIKAKGFNLYMIERSIFDTNYCETIDLKLAGTWLK